MEHIGIYLEHLIQLIYPNLCMACMQKTRVPDELCCMQCLNKLAFTDLHLAKENLFTEHFWGRVDIESASALFYYSKANPIQELIHHLKYNKRKTVGLALGELHAQSLKESPLFQNIDLIIPVPLHPKKEFQRGYNQSMVYAQGLAKHWGIPVSRKHLLRRKLTSTQTSKTRIERMENMKDAFVLRNIDQLKGKHVLLVDDVMTTGATLEACALKLKEVLDIKISLATLAIAK
jgi:ComF family protein